MNSVLSHHSHGWKSSFLHFKSHSFSSSILNPFTLSIKIRHRVHFFTFCHSHSLTSLTPHHPFYLLCLSFHPIHPFKPLTHFLNLSSPVYLTQTSAWVQALYLGSSNVVSSSIRPSFSHPLLSNSPSSTRLAHASSQSNHLFLIALWSLILYIHLFLFFFFFFLITSSWPYLSSPQPGWSSLRSPTHSPVIILLLPLPPSLNPTQIQTWNPSSFLIYPAQLLQTVPSISYIQVTSFHLPSPWAPLDFDHNLLLHLILHVHRLPWWWTDPQEKITVLIISVVELIILLHLSSQAVTTSQNKAHHARNILVHHPSVSALERSASLSFSLLSFSSLITHHLHIHS